MGPYEKFEMWKIGTVTFRVGAVTKRVNICRINTSKQEELNYEVISDYKIIKHAYIYTYICIKLHKRRKAFL